MCEGEGLTTRAAVNSPEAKLAWEKKKELDHRKEHLKEWEVLDLD